MDALTDLISASWGTAGMVTPLTNSVPLCCTCHNGALSPTLESNTQSFIQFSDSLSDTVLLPLAAKPPEPIDA